MEKRRLSWKPSFKASPRGSITKLYNPAKGSSGNSNVPDFSTSDGKLSPTARDLYVIKERNSGIASERGMQGKLNSPRLAPPPAERYRNSPPPASYRTEESTSRTDISRISLGTVELELPTPESSMGPTPGGNSRRSSRETPGAFDYNRLLKSNGQWSTTTLSSAATDTAEELGDHINVVLRVRPLNSLETNRRDTVSTSFPGGGRVECENNGTTRSFAYNVVFEHESTQEDLFEHSGVKKLIDMAMNGYACTALAFGQTGSGKTHTMTGPPQSFEGGKHPPKEMVGIMQRSFQYLFNQLSQQPGNKIIRASYLEIYNEQVVDLLNPIHRRYLQVRWSKNKGFYVENLFVMECETIDDLNAVLEEGMRNRQTASHGLNETSSRSHAMMTLSIDSEQQDPDDENLYLTKRGKLTFVDLAGSEKVKDSHSTAETLIESNNINRSLLVLGNCISSLGDPKRRQGHIPYRDSKLTKLLADSLGGSGVTLMIACITPSSHHVSETMNTLRYASRAKRIRTKPLIKMDPREKLIVSLKREIKILRNENIYLRQQLEFPAKPKGALQKENDEKFMKFLKDQKTVKPGAAKTPQPNKQEEGGLYEMLQEYMIENEALRSENAELHATKDKIRREQQLLYRDNEKMMKRIEDLERLMGTTTWPRQQEQFYNPPVERQVSQSPRQSPASFNHSPQWQQQGRHPSQEHFSGTSSPNGVNRGKGPPPPHAQPKRPPHRLPDTIARPAQIPPDMQNGIHNNGHHPMQNGPTRQESPARIDSRRSSQISTSDSVRSMNEKLKQELLELEGEIAQHQIANKQTKNVYGSQTSIRSGPR